MSGMNNLSRWLSWFLYVATIATMVAAPFLVLLLLVTILFLH